MEPGQPDRKGTGSLPHQDRQELKITEGGMEVYLTLVPVPKGSGGDRVPSLEDLKKWIREQGIHSELDLSAIQRAIDRAKQGLPTQFLVSHGKPALQGKDGYIEYLLDLGHSSAPKISEAGTVDLRASLIHKVKPGEPLALIHPPTAGEPGIDVFGKLVASQPGKILDPQIGLNTQRSPKNLNLIIAQTAGHVRQIEGVVEVQEIYSVAGDIDYATGNISFEKSVLVQGDVKSGFSVDAGADLEVTGLVEDCQIKSKGKVCIGGGFTGQGKGLIQAQGDVFIGYIRNQHVKSEKAIVIQKEAVNSRLQARQSITINGLLAGGRVQARYAIDCQVAGTETGTPTQIEAGYDYTANEEKAELKVELDRMGKYAKKLSDSVREMQKIEKTNRGLEPWSIELLFEIETGRAKVEAKIKSLRERYSALEAQTSKPEKATITVHRKAFSGVVIKIGNDMFLVEEPLQGPKTFFAKDGIIQIR